MGKLLAGHYGRPPEAESIPLTLKEAGLQLGLTPSDFVSEGPPNFFKKSFGAPGRYLLFLTDAKEVLGSPVWKQGFYLLPLQAVDVLKALGKNHHSSVSAGEGRVLPVHVSMETAPPPSVQKRLDAWVVRAQPLFFTCGCDHLELKMSAPWGLRRRWKARIRCPGRCQPVLEEVF